MHSALASVVSFTPHNNPMKSAASHTVVIIVAVVILHDRKVKFKNVDLIVVTRFLGLKLWQSDLRAHALKHGALFPSEVPIFTYKTLRML